jgi:hypothetical protein
MVRKVGSKVFSFFFLSYFVVFLKKNIQPPLFSPPCNVFFFVISKHECDS